MKKRKYNIKAIIGEEEIKPKGFYYQGNYIVLVGDEIKKHTMRRRLRIDEVNIIIEENK